MAYQYQCPHCGDVFDAGTFEQHITLLARRATPQQVTDWLYRWTEERWNR